MTDLLLEHARTRPRAVALIDLQRKGHELRLSFADCVAAVDARAQLLRSLGLRAGQAVLVIQPMSADLYVTLGALFRLGLVAMIVDPGAGLDHLARCCALYPPSALVATPKAHLLRLVSPALRRIPIKCTAGSTTGLAVPGSVLLPEPRLGCDPPTAFGVASPDDPDLPALITFTSGSTGAPKAIVRSHAFLLAQHRAICAVLKPYTSMTDLATMPIVALSNLASGVTSLIPYGDLRRPGELPLWPLIRALERHRVSTTVASPALLERLVRHYEQGSRKLPFRTIFTGGAPVFPQLLRRLGAVSSGEVYAVYGSSEAEPIAQLWARQVKDADRAAMDAGKGVLAGRPVDAVQLRILPDRWGTPLGPYGEAEFAALCLPAGAHGEIVVAGEHVVRGYLRGHGDAEAKIDVAGTIWHRTGDAGYLDARGRLWLLGRCSARIDDAHGSLYPLGVECALGTLAQVRRSALVSHNGARILCLELAPTSQRPLRREDVLELLGKLDVAVDRIMVFEQLPVDRRHNAKIDYPRLRALLDGPPGGLRRLLTRRVPAFWELE